MEIITAIGDRKLNNLLKERSFNVKYDDFQYQEAILEILKKDKKINILFLYSSLPGELSIYELINEIIKTNEKIKIIIILEKENEALINFLNAKGIFDIFYNNKIKTEKIIEFLEEKNKKSDNKNRININKTDREIGIIKNKGINQKIIWLKKIKEKINQKIKEIIKIKDRRRKTSTKIINISGPPGVGKTIFTIIFSLLIKNKKILIIDFDANKNITKILNINKKKNNLKENKYSKNIYIKNINKKNYEKKEIKDFIENKIKEYEIIILDNPNIFLEEIIKNIDLNIILTEANLIQINNTKKIIEKYLYKYNIEKNKIKIIINKFNFYSIDFSILKKIFNEIEILEKIKINNKYNLIINKSIKEIDNKIKKEYEKIIKKIFRNKE